MRAPFDSNAHHARLLTICASYRKQIASGRTIFDREFLMSSARACIDGARDTRLAVEGWRNALVLMLAYALLRSGQ